MAEPTHPPWPVRASGLAGFTNPILYIEELRRFPAQRSRVPAPGTTLVFRARRGRLSAPRGGYTAGEMFFLGPRTGYQIDTSPHGFAASFEVGPPAGPVLAVDVTGTWSVADPVAVVAHRVSDLEYACTTELVRQIELVVPSGRLSPDEVRDLLRTAWKSDVEVRGGIRLRDLHAEVGRADVLTGEKVIQFLAADEEDDGPGDPAGLDPGQFVQEIQGLAEEALAALAAEQGTAGLTGVVGRALLRFREMADRMHDVLPPAENGEGRENGGSRESRENGRSRESRENGRSRESHESGRSRESHESGRSGSGSGESREDRGDSGVNRDHGEGRPRDDPGR